MVTLFIAPVTKSSDPRSRFFRVQVGLQKPAPHRLINAPASPKSILGAAWGPVFFFFFLGGGGLGFRVFRA